MVALFSGRDVPGRYGRLARSALLGVLLSSAPSFAEPGPAEWPAHIDDLKLLLEREPRNPNHYLRIAQAYSVIGDTRQVIDYARMAQERGAHATQAYLLIGDHFLRLGKYDRALNAFQRALRNTPENARGWTQMWRALYELRRENQQSAIDTTTIGQDLEAQGFYFPEAWRQPGEPPTEDPEIARRLTRTGYRALERDDVAGAVRSFRQALNAEPTYAEAFRGLGIAHARKRRLKLALGAYTLFLELAGADNPDIPAIRKIIVDFYRSKSTGG